MNGIDISSHNTGINTKTIPGNFVIIKATQGLSYVNPDFKRAIKQAQGSKLLGIYHYIGGQGAAGEMDNFIKHWKTYKGQAIACLDWESYQNSAWGNEDYLRQCIEYFIKQTGVIPFVYASLSSFPHSLCKKFGCPKWIAQYANDKETGYQETPWNQGKYSCAIRQYTSNGKLNGWSGRLDLNKAYITREQWANYCGEGANAPTTPTTPSTPSATGNTWVRKLQEECNTQGFSNQTVDGIAGPNTLAGCPTVKQGAQGGITRLIQQRLNEIGFNCGTVDGIYGPNTVKGIKAYQKTKGLTVDGIVGPKTWKSLLGL